MKIFPVTYDLVYLPKYIENDIIYYLEVILTDKFVNKNIDIKNMYILNIIKKSQKSTKYFYINVHHKCKK